MNNLGLLQAGVAGQEVVVTGLAPISQFTSATK